MQRTLYIEEIVQRVDAVVARPGVFSGIGGVGATWIRVWRVSRVRSNRDVV